MVSLHWRCGGPARYRSRDYAMSRPARCAGHRAQGPSRLAVAAASVLAPAFPGHVLTVPSTVPRSRRLGRGAVVLVTSKLRSLLRTAQTIRASLLASAMASTL